MIAIFKPIIQMKRKTKPLLPIFILSFSIILFSDSISASLLNPPIGKIVLLKGSSDVIDLGSKSHKSAQMDQYIYRNDEIRTGPNSIIEVLMTNGDKITIYSRTVINIREDRYSKKKETTIRLLIGLINISIPIKLQPHETFMVKTPTAVSTVRGTDFGVIASMEETRVVVYNGVVRTYSRNPGMKIAYDLMPNYEVRVLKNQEPDRPRLLRDQQLDDWFEYYYISSEGKIKRKIREPRRLLDRIIEKKSFP